MLDLKKMTEIGVPGRAHGGVGRRLIRSCPEVGAGSSPPYITVRITTLAEYGVICALHLARRASEGPITGREIAEVERLPGDYVEQILLRLRRAEHRAKHTRRARRLRAGARPRGHLDS